MKRILSMVLTAALAGVGGSLQAEDTPSLETCVRYAETDHAYTVAEQAAQADYKAAMQAADAARQEAQADYNAAKQAADADYNAAWQAAKASRDAAMQAAKASRAAAMQEAKASRAEDYLDIYEDADGVESKVPEIMAKLFVAHRKHCLETHGL